MVRYTNRVAVVVLAGSLAGATTVRAGGLEACADSGEAAAPLALRITSGVEQRRVWLAAEYEGLRINKFTSKDGASVIEFRYRDDYVVFELKGAEVTVARNGMRLSLSRTEAEPIQRLLGDSLALFHTRAMLSRVAPVSSLDAPQMSLLSAAAFAAAVTGDTQAPLRLADRFVAKHMGVIRPIRFGESCFTSYVNETYAAWNDYEACLWEAYQGSWALRSIRETACAATWVWRVESAWFEYLSCLSPLSIKPT